ncbi:MAG: UDP-N-acetylmuramoyl-tripeptide--D-alanyl-D-alanine ligase [Candidatus Paceibacterota bacterium]|jgi:UDP-N-acetylmuramoyl-tripeptide--D-alanyl-D-alanine ligase
MKTIFKKIIVAILTLEAKAVLARFKPKIVAITGSVGKTSAKDAIYAVLATKFSTRKSEKSFNSEIGAPLTILGLPNGWNNPFVWLVILVSGALCLFQKKYPEWLVLEIGADRPNDIKKLASWIKPDVVVITRFAKIPVHVEFFASPRQVIEEKMNLARALKEDGVLILNGDDDDILEAKDEILRRKIIYGFGSKVLIRAVNEKIIYATDGAAPAGMSFEVSVSTYTIKDSEKTSLGVKIPDVLGKQIIYAALAALAVANSQDINLPGVIGALDNMATPPGRMKILRGIKNSLIIDDTYNSSPVALEEALLTLENLKCKGRKIAVLGDMLELGKHSNDEHEKAGALAGNFVDLLITVGKRAEGFTTGALKAGLAAGKIIRLENSREAGNYLDQNITAGDIILVKGSQGVRMEKTVEEIMAEPENKEKLLVRQDKEWQKR